MSGVWGVGAGREPVPITGDYEVTSTKSITCFNARSVTRLSSGTPVTCSSISPKHIQPPHSSSTKIPGRNCLTGYSRRRSRNGSSSGIRLTGVVMSEFVYLRCFDCGKKQRFPPAGTGRPIDSAKAAKAGHIGGSRRACENVVLLSPVENGWERIGWWPASKLDAYQAWHRDLQERVEMLEDRVDRCIARLEARVERVETHAND